MPGPTPLTTKLSWAWIAYTIEVDNAVEAAASERVGQLFRISLAMWANGLRCLDDDGVTVADLSARSRADCNLAGLERWGWIEIDPPGTAGRRPGFGSRRGITQTTVVRATRAGRHARRVWPRALEAVDARWRTRFGAARVDELHGALDAAFREGRGTAPLPVGPALPWAPPEVAPSDGFRSEVVGGRTGDDDATSRPLGVKLGQVLTAWTLELERGSEVSLPLSADLLRVIDTDVVPVSYLPRSTGLSQEAVAMAVGYARRAGLAQAGPNRSLSLTGAGLEALDDYRRRVADAEDPRLRRALENILDQNEALAAGLVPPDGGWRAAPPYLAQTQRMLADPAGSLPWHPMVLHRGGWPDGS